MEVLKSIPKIKGIGASASTEQLQHWGTAILRVMVGVLFLAHSLQRLFVTGMRPFADFLSQIGIPLETAVAIVITVLQGLCGLALVAGFLTRWAAGFLALSVLGAFLFVYLPAGYFNLQGYEHSLMLLAACISLIFFGSGAYSVDNMLRWKEARKEEVPVTRAA